MDFYDQIYTQIRPIEIPKRRLLNLEESVVFTRK